MVLEAAAQVGGAALTREFAPGFRVSAGAHLLHLMPADLLRELQLGSHGLEWAAQGMATTALVPGGARLRLTADGAHQGLSAADTQAYAGYTARMRRFAAALAPMFSRVPPRLGTAGWADRLALLRIGWQIRRLGRRDMRELLRRPGANCSIASNAVSVKRCRPLCQPSLSVYGAYCTMADSTCCPAGASAGSLSVGTVISMTGAAEYSPYFA